MKSNANPACSDGWEAGAEDMAARLAREIDAKVMAQLYAESIGCPIPGGVKPSTETDKKKIVEVMQEIIRRERETNEPV